jgi:putative ABC transport system substrate-binding protein
MRRISLILLSLLIAVALAPRTGSSQQAVKVARIGVLVTSSAAFAGPNVDVFRQRLRELGYVEGQNLVLEVRYADGKAERLPSFATELVGLRVDAILTEGTPAARAAKQATATIPIVLGTIADPVGTGLVSSLARPGGNITGSAFLFSDLVVKRVELLKEALPALRRVGVLANPANPVVALALKEIEGQGQALGVELPVAEARAADEIDRAFSSVVEKRVQVVVVLEDGMLHAQARRIAELSARNRLPVVFGPRELATSGVMAYGHNRQEFFRRAADYVDRILKGARPADLPIELPTRYELVVNLANARALGLTIPSSVLSRADKVIE